MIYEYAVSPQLFGSRANLALLFHAFRADHGRMVSDYPRRRWVQLTHALIKSAVSEDSERKECVELLMALQKHALVERQAPLWTDGKLWVENAIDEHKRLPFHGIVADKQISSLPQSIAVGPSMNKNGAWNTPATRSVPRRAREMLESVRSLIDMSTSIVLIDRNFNPSDRRFVSVLTRFAEHIKAKTHHPRIQQIKYVTTYELSGTTAEFEKSCRTFLPNAIPVGISVRFYLKVKNLFHPRFVLTNLGGVNFEYGLDEGDGEVLVSRLSSEDFQQQWDSTELKVAHSFTIEGCKQ
jgi:hypothetical protein